MAAPPPPAPRPTGAGAAASADAATARVPEVQPMCPAGGPTFPGGSPRLHGGGPVHPRGSRNSRPISKDLLRSEDSRRFWIACTLFASTLCFCSSDSVPSSCGSDPSGVRLQRNGEQQGRNPHLWQKASFERGRLARCCSPLVSEANARGRVMPPMPARRVGATAGAAARASCDKTREIRECSVLLGAVHCSV